MTTPSEVEAEVERRVEMARVLTRLETKMDQCLVEVTDTKVYVREVSARTRSLELWRGGIAATVTALSAAVAYLFKGGN